MPPPRSCRSARRSCAGRWVRQAELKRLRRRRDDMQAATADAQAEGRRVGNVAVLELELASLEREEQQLLLERDALKIAFQTLQEVAVEFSSTHRERLAQRAGAIFAQITGVTDRGLQLDERFAIAIVGPQGRPCAIRQLSQGARDQLLLSLRLAVAESLSGEARPPLLFDDPFLSFDPERLAAMREALTRLSAQRQILLLTHRPELAEWGTPVTVTA